jgi:predicted RNA-binding Zn ribbon-like protein
MSKTSRKFQVPDELAHLYDFANTLDLRRFVHNGVKHQTADEVGNTRDLARWMEERGLLVAGTNLTTTMFEVAIRLRASIRAYLATDATERHHDKDIVRELNKAIRPFPVVVEVLTKNGMTLGPTRTDALAGLSSIVGELYNGSANGTLSRLKMCAAEECCRVFYDRSKPATRRWCQTELCGNRMKTRTYRHRKKA